MMKHLADRKFKLIRNAVIIVLALLLVWLLLGVPALTKTQAFRRAMREHFLVPKDPKVFFGTDRSLSALAEVDGVYVQTCLGKWIGWQHSNWSETEAVDGVYIVPLFAQGQKIECPEVAVLRHSCLIVWESRTGGSCSGLSEMINIAAELVL